jgi:hypothetical protein
VSSDTIYNPLKQWFPIFYVSCTPKPKKKTSIPPSEFLQDIFNECVKANFKLSSHVLLLVRVAKPKIGNRCSRKIFVNQMCIKILNVTITYKNIVKNPWFEVKQKNPGIRVDSESIWETLLKMSNINAQFHQHFTRGFLVRKFRAQLFFLHLKFVVFDTKYAVKCWWNRHEDGTFYCQMMKCTWQTGFVQHYFDCRTKGWRIVN